MKNLLNLVIHPKKYFSDIKDREKISIIFPIILLVAVFLLTTFSAHISMAKMSTNSPVALNQSSFTIFAIMGAIGALVFIILSWLIAAGIYNFVFKKMGGSGNFKRTLYVVAVSMFPSIFQLIISLFFIPDLDPTHMAATNTWSILTNYINIFNIWAIILTIIGLSVIHELNIKKSAMVVIIYEIISILLTVGFTLLTTSMIPSA